MSSHLAFANLFSSQRQALESAEAGGAGGNLGRFLRQFVLIKTPHGYILGKNSKRGGGDGVWDEEDDDDAMQVGIVQCRVSHSFVKCYFSLSMSDPRAPLPLRRV